MQPFTYRHAAPSVKIAATGFLLLAVLGLGITVLQTYARTGLTPGGALRHYQGDEATLQYPPSFNEMVETAHAHAFTMPLLALVLSVAFVATRTPEWAKQVVVAALLGGVLLELGVPWLVRYGPAWTAFLFGPAAWLLGGSLLVAAGVPLYEMWLSDKEAM